MTATIKTPPGWRTPPRPVLAVEREWWIDALDCTHAYRRGAICAALQIGELANPVFRNPHVSHPVALRRRYQTARRAADIPGIVFQDWWKGYADLLAEEVSAMWEVLHEL